MDRSTVLDVVHRVLQEVTALTLPLDVPGAVQMRCERENVLNLLHGYLVTRLDARDRPLLVVIGGPTGAGKSTLLNSLVGTPVSRTGVLRPTTRTPVLLHHPRDSAAVTTQRFTPDRQAVQTVAHTEITPGLALLDSPDLDSWLVANRQLASELLRIADLWLLVTTGTDYADAVPWDLLRSAVDRKVSVAVVLNRMRPRELESVREDLTRMLAERGVPHARLFVIPETVLQAELIPYRLVASLHSWLSEQTGVGTLRDAYLERAVEGTLEQVILGVRRLVEAAADQVVADRRLRVDLEAVFGRTREELPARALDGSVTEALRPGWRDITSSAATGTGGLRRRLGLALGLTPAPFGPAGQALREALAHLATDALARARATVARQWTNHPAAPPLDPVDDTLRGRADEALCRWLDAVEANLTAAAMTARGHGGDRWHSMTVMVATLAVCARTTDPEGPGAVARRLLYERHPSIDVSPAVERATQELGGTLAALVDEQRTELEHVLDAAAVSAGSGRRLREALASLEALRSALAADTPMTELPRPAR